MEPKGEEEEEGFEGAEPNPVEVAGADDPNTESKEENEKSGAEDPKGEVD